MIWYVCSRDKIDVQKTLYVHCNVHQLMMFFSVHVSFYCVCIYMVWYGVWYDMMWDKNDVRKIHKLYWSNMTMMWFDDMILCTSTIHIYIYYDMIWYNVIWYDVIYCDLINYDLYNGVLWFNGIIYIYIWQWTIVTSLICTNLNLMCIYIYAWSRPPHDLPSMSSSMIHLQS